MARKRLTSEQAQENQNRRIVSLWANGQQIETIVERVKRNDAFVNKVIKEYNESENCKLFAWETAGPLFIAGY